jgi:N-methylhydantoinase B
MATSFNEIRTQVMWARLLAVVEEQAQTLLRTAFSTVVCEAGDLSAGVFDLDGRMVAQAATGTPGHVNTMAETVRDFLERFPAGEMKPGDHFITNDPWRGAGHLHDVTVVTPAFHEGRIVALFSCICHQIDIGGRGLGPDGESVYEEGLFIPLMRLARAGQLNDSLLDIIRHNVRSPYEVEGDILSYMTCNELGARRLSEMLAEFPEISFATLSDFVIERSRQAMLTEMRKLPKASLSYEMTVDGYDQPITLKCRVDTGDDKVLIDFDGSSPASRYGINLVLNYTKAYASFAVRSSLAPDVPNNAGSLAAIEVVAPLGCIANVEWPAPVAARHIIGQLVPDVVFGCLAQVMPDVIPAEGASSIWSLQLRGGPEATWDEAGPTPKAFSLLSFNSGGSGARPNKDGLSVTAFPSGVRGTSVEALENAAPVVIWKKELLSDSGGPGAHRGGLGQLVEVSTIDSSPFFVFAMYDRVFYPARGRAGGESGAAGGAAMDDGTALRVKGKQRIPRGRRLQLRLPGGGGIGDPLQRDLAKVSADLAAGIVTAEGALKQYGVLTKQDGSIDEIATRAERQRATGRADAGRKVRSGEPAGI